MRRLAAFSAICMIATSAAFAGEADPAAALKELEAQRQEAAKQTEAARAAALTEQALASERQAVVAARKAYDDALANDAGIAKAKADLVAAEADLKKAMQAKEAASPERAALKEARAKVDRLERELNYRRDLLKVHATHDGSPIRAVIEADAGVQAAENARKDLDGKMLNEAVVISDKARAVADRAVREQEIAIDSLPAVAKAIADLRAADLAEREALGKDPRRGQEQDARMALESAEMAVLKNLPETKAQAEELAKLDQALSGPESELRPLSMLLEEVGREVGAKDAGVAKAKAAVETIREKVAAIDPQRAAAVKTAVAALAEAQARVEKTEACAKLIAERTTHDAKLALLRSQAAAATSKEDLLAQAKAIRETRHLRYTVNGQIEALLKADASYATALAARIQAQRALDEAVAATPAGAAAQQALRKSEQAQDQAQTAAVQANQAGTIASSLLNERRTRLNEVRYRRDLLRVQLTSRNAPHAEAVQSAKVVVAAKAVQEALRKDLAEKPLETVTVAEERRNEIRKAVEEARAQAPQQAKLAEARKERDAKHKAYDEARAAVRAEVKYDEALKVVEAARTKAMQADATCAKLLTEIADLEKRLADGKTALKEAEEKAQAVQKSLGSSEDPALVAARGKSDAARKAVTEAQNAPALTALKGKIQEAEKAQHEKEAKLLTADQAYQAAKKAAEALEVKRKELEKAQKATDKEKAKADKAVKPAAK